jgi:hypothetical protein
MVRSSRKRKKRDADLDAENEPRPSRRQLAKDPRVTELIRSRWRKLRALAKDDKFRQKTRDLRKALKTAFEHNPGVVKEFFRNFWYPAPATFIKAWKFLKDFEAVALRKTLRRYLKYASRFGVYMVYWEEKAKFRVRVLVPRGTKFHVRVVNDHLESASWTPKGHLFSDYFADEKLKVLPEMQKRIHDGTVRLVQIEDDSFSTVLSELEEFAYFPDAITFVLHNAERPYLFCLFGERVTQPDFREAGKVVSAILRQKYGRGKGGRPRDRVREKKALNLLKKPGSKAEKASALAPGGEAKHHFSAERYIRTVKKRNP